MGIACLFLFPSDNHTSEKNTIIPSSNTFFERHPSIFIYPASNKEVVIAQYNHPSKNNAAVVTKERKDCRKTQ